MFLPLGLELKEFRIDIMSQLFRGQIRNASKGIQFNSIHNKLQYICKYLH